MNKRIIYDWPENAIKEIRQAKDKGDTSAIVIWNILKTKGTLLDVTDVFIHCEDENLFIRDIADYFCELAEFEVEE